MKVVAMAEVTIRQATIDDSRIVAALVLALLKEIDPPFAATLTLDGLRRVAETLLAEGQGFWAFLAIDVDGNAVGEMALEAVRARLRQVGKVRQLELERGGSTLSVSVELRVLGSE